MHGHHASIVRASILYVQQRHNNAVIIHQLLPAIPSFHPFLSFSSIPSAQSHNLMTISPSHPSSCPIPYIVHHWLPSSHPVQSHPSFMITHSPVLFNYRHSSIISSSSIASFTFFHHIIQCNFIILSHPFHHPVQSNTHHHSSMILSSTVHPIINCHRQDNVWETLPPIQGPYLLLHSKSKKKYIFPHVSLKRGVMGMPSAQNNKEAKKSA